MVPASHGPAPDLGAGSNETLFGIILNKAGVHAVGQKRNMLHLMHPRCNLKVQQLCLSAHVPEKHVVRTHGTTDNPQPSLSILRQEPPLRVEDLVEGGEVARQPKDCAVQVSVLGEEVDAQVPQPRCSSTSGCRLDGWPGEVRPVVTPGQAGQKERRQTVVPRSSSIPTVLVRIQDTEPDQLVAAQGRSPAQGSTPTTIFCEWINRQSRSIVCTLSSLCV